MARGGFRIGSGRKPKPAHLRVLQGKPSTAPRQPDPVAPTVIDEFDAPNDLTTDERNVWLDLAPHAFKARTLTKSTAFAFKMLCRNVLLERRYAGSVQDAGGPNHRGLIKTIDSELARFCLAPFGKPVITDEKPQVVDPFDEFSSQLG